MPASTRSVSAWMLAIERELDVLAGLRGVERVALELVAERVADDLALAVGAVQDVVLGRLEPGQARVVDADGADHLARELALRVDAAAVREEPMPGRSSFSICVGLIEVALRAT